MNRWSVIGKSVRYYWQVHLAMLLAMAVTTAVLTGALTVGDSMRGSLRQLTLQRLGPIDQVLVSQSLIDQATAQQWAATPEFLAAFQRCIPTLHFPAATLELVDRQNPELQDWTSVAVWGGDQTLASLNWDDAPLPELGPNDIVINRQAAQRLGLTPQEIGTAMTLRIGKPSDVPTESFIAKKDDSISSLPRLRLAAILPDRGLGRLGLTPNTEAPALAFVHIETLQRVIPLATRNARGSATLVNTLLLTQSATTIGPAEATAARQAFRPSLADAGLKLIAVTDSPLNYYSLSSSRLLIDAGQQRAIEAALRDLPFQPVLTYLANDMAAESATTPGIPFSMISGLDPDPRWTFPLEAGGELESLADDEIVLNSWAVQDLNLQVGQSIRLKYFEPETVDGLEVEREAVFRLKGVAAVTTPAEPYQTRGRQTIPAKFRQPATTANDPWLTPEVPGVTDAVSIEAWDLPFETASKIRPQDDDYWQFFRTTPKGFVSLAAGQKLWASRFGQLTSYRVPAEITSEVELTRRLEAAIADPLADVGFQILPVKAQGLLASQGSTPFDVLFLMFSLFVVVSSLLLLVLFVRLGLQQRSAELGLWLALGFSARQVTRLWWLESLAAALGGMVLGTGLGVAYAGLMAWLMRTAWVGAVASPFLNLHWTWRSLLLGGAASLLVGSGVVAWSLRRAARVPARSLLTGRWNDDDSQRPPTRWWFQRRTTFGLALLALASALGGLWAAGDAQAVAFMAGGMSGLLAALTAIYAGLIHPPSRPRLSWADIGRLNLARQPLRSLMIVGLVGIATFLILAVSAFRLSPTERGTAGFSFLVRTDIGILEDLNDPQVRQRLLSQNQVSQDQVVAPDPAEDSGLRFYGFRFHDGEHASCNNPYQAGQPQVLGVSTAFVSRFDDPAVKPFAWVGHAGTDPQTRDNPWRLLGPRPEPQASPGPIPVVIDKNTAWYSLKVYLPGTQFSVDFPGVGVVDFVLVGLLDNSVLQGALLVSEADFLGLFPTNTGNRYFLVDRPAAGPSDTLAGLGRALKSSGWQSRTTESELANYMAVQNTYLSAFQSLGSLGLLLGTIGLVVAQFRSLLERRRELALLQAMGFPLSRIQALVTGETLRLMGLGFAAGLGSALLGVLPHVWLGAAELPLAWILMVVAAIGLIGWVAARVVGRWAVKGNLLQLLRGQ
jgi:putative ABC transport system permease protein